jgi:uncharacterized protein
MPRHDIAQLQMPTQYLASLRELLTQHVPHAEVWAFGSRVAGRAHEGSDLDLVLRNPTDLSQPVEGWLDLKEALQNSRLPILVEVHDWSHLPTDFHANIVADYAVLQSGTGSLDPAEAERAGV